MEIFKLFGRILIDDKEAGKSLSRTEKSSKSLGERFKGGIKTAAKWGAAIAAGATVAIGGIAAIGAPMVKAAAEMEALNAQFDQVFADLGDSAQKTIDGLGKSFGMLPNRIKPAFTQTTSMFKGLGLSTEDAMDQAETAVTLVADAAAFYDKSFEDANSALNSFIKGNYEGGESIGLFANETQLAAYASKELGLDWKSLDEAGKQVARMEYAQAMQEAAGATGQAARESDGFENVMGNMKQAWTDLMVKFGQPLLEPVIGWIQQLTQWLTQVNFQPLIEGFTFLVDMIAQGVQTLVGWIQTLATNNSEVFSGIWTIIQEVFLNIWTFIQEIWGYIQVFWQANGEQILANAMIIFNLIKDTVMIAFNEIWNVIQTVLNLVTPFIQQTLAKIQAFWKQNGEQIMQAIQNAFTFIQNVISIVMPIVQSIIKSSWSIIQSIIDTAIGIIMGLIKFFASLLTGDFKGMKDGLTKIWNSLWSGIKGIVSGVWGLLSGAFSSLWSSISGWFTGLKDDALQWGKNMIQGFIDGIKKMGEKVKNAVSGVMNKVKGFLGFNSPAKEGEGRHIVEWGSNMIDGFLDGVRNMVPEAEITMNRVVGSMHPDDFEKSNKQPERKSSSDNGILVELLLELIQAVREGKNIVINDKVIAQETGDARSEYDGKRVRRVERELAI